MESGEPAEAGQEQGAKHGTGSEGEGAGEAFGGQAEPEVDAREDHGDESEGEGVHGEGPEHGGEPVALVADIVGTDAGEGVEEAQDTPGVELGLFDRGAGGRFIEGDLPAQARADEAKGEGGRGGGGGGPFDFAVEAELAHQIVGAGKLVGRGGVGDGLVEFRNLAVGPELGEGPGVVQQQAGEGEQPEGEQEVETEIVVRPAVRSAEGFRR